MFCRRLGTLSWVKRACLGGRFTTLLTKCRITSVSATMDQRTSSHLSSRVQRAAILQIGYIARRPEKVFEARYIMSPTQGSRKKFSSLAEDLKPWNCYHDEMVKLVRNGGALIIDVRRADEIKATGKMNGAYHIPLDELKEAFELPEDKFREKYGMKKPNPDGSNIVFSCRSGRRSLEAIEIAKQFGYKKARHYPGGWNGWVEQSKL